MRSTIMAREIDEIMVKKEESETLRGLLFSQPSFFKVLIGDDYSDKLRVPPFFAKKCLDKVSGKSFDLETHCGSWTVEIAQTGKRGYFFKKGWAAFVRANNIEFGDFLVFFLTGPCRLSVMMYDKTACVKNLVSLVGRRKKKKSNTHEPATAATKMFCDTTDEPAPTATNGHCYEYCVTLKKYNKYNMRLKRDFMRGSGLAQMMNVEVTNGEGGSWPVEVGSGGRRLGGGWSKFWIDNNLAAGDRCMVRFTRDNSRNSRQVEFLKLKGEAGQEKATPWGDHELWSDPSGSVG
uniref:TF-B3 domain-containing protein n=1 Tax=Kalanchoe fedtschenkoi TaxID=63787 RepID=A0A7N0RHH5_KALFE